VSAALRCSGTPISWLRLEQHHAGELTTEESAAITAHLATCGACAACLARIRDDEAAPLRSLEIAAPSPRPARVVAFRRFVPVVAALAVAAAVLVAIGRRPDAAPRGAELDPLAARTKGGSVSFVLVRDDEEAIAEAGGVYRDGDRWKALVTCPAGLRASWDLAVFEHGDVAFPLEAQAELPCGNAVPLPGAFRTTGHEPMTVCVLWNDGALVDRAALRGTTPETLAHAACKLLDPAR
jgi:Putative zinc-finger